MRRNTGGHLDAAPASHRRLTGRDGARTGRRRNPQGARACERGTSAAGSAGVEGSQCAPSLARRWRGATRGRDASPCASLRRAGVAPRRSGGASLRGATDTNHGAGTTAVHCRRRPPLTGGVTHPYQGCTWPPPRPASPQPPRGRFVRVRRRDAAGRRHVTPCECSGAHERAEAGAEGRGTRREEADERTEPRVGFLKQGVILFFPSLRAHGDESGSPSFSPLLF